MDVAAKLHPLSTKVQASEFPWKFFSQLDEQWTMQILLCVQEHNRHHRAKLGNGEHYIMGILLTCTEHSDRQHCSVNIMKEAYAKKKRHHGSIVRLKVVGGWHEVVTSSLGLMGQASRIIARWQLWRPGVIPSLATSLCDMNGERKAKVVLLRSLGVWNTESGRHLEMLHSPVIGSVFRRPAVLVHELLRRLQRRLSLGTLATMAFSSLNPTRTRVLLFWSRLFLSYWTLSIILSP